VSANAFLALSPGECKCGSAQIARSSASTMQFARRYDADYPTEAATVA